MSIQSAIEDTTIERRSSFVRILAFFALDHEVYTESTYYNNLVQYRKIKANDFQETHFLLDELNKTENSIAYLERLRDFLSQKSFPEGVGESDIKISQENVDKAEEGVERIRDFLNEKLRNLLDHYQLDYNGEGVGSKRSIALLELCGFFENKRVIDLTQKQRNELVSQITGRNPQTISTYIKAFITIGTQGYTDKIDVPKEKSIALKFYNKLINNQL